LGQKTHPVGFRLGYIKSWESKWFSEKDYTRLLHEDLKIRKYIKDKLHHAGISKVEIERSTNKCRVNIYSARPAMIIGRRGQEVDLLKKELQQFTKSEVFVNILEVRPAETDAQLVAENIALQIERRVSYRRAMKKAMTLALKFGAKGIKVRTGGRLGGAEIARSEWYRQGSVPLHTLRADIDYGYARAQTTYGIIGVKCWIFKGEILKGKGVQDAKL